MLAHGLHTLQSICLASARQLYHAHNKGKECVFVNKRECGNNHINSQRVRSCLCI